MFKFFIYDCFFCLQQYTNPEKTPNINTKVIKSIREFTDKIKSDRCNEFKFNLPAVKMQQLQTPLNSKDMLSPANK